MIQKFNFHDQSLFEKISGIFSQDLQIYLSEFDFANTGHTRVLDELFETTHYSDTLDYTFIDIDDDFLEVYINLKQSMNIFQNIFVKHTTPTGNGMFQVASQKDWDFGDHKRYREEANAINTSAAVLFEVMQKFIIAGKKRIFMEDQRTNGEFTTRDFNELFNKINIKETSSYFSGPRFFKLVNRFDTAHEDYYQYMDERKRRKLPTSRKVVFKDVLDQLEDKTRNLIVGEINKILHEDNTKSTENKINTTSNDKWKIEPKVHTDSFNKPTVLEADDNQMIVEEGFVHIESPTLSLISMGQHPKVFISYSWDDEEHKDWILKLSHDLRMNGVETILDRYSLSPGKNASHFMEDSIEKADKILIIFTENYKDRASSREGGVGIEYSMLNREICDNIIDNDKYIPVLRKGSQKNSIPLFMRQYIALYMTDDTKYEEKLKELLHSIFDKPMVTIPEIGQVPDYIKN